MELKLVMMATMQQEMDVQAYALLKLALLVQLQGLHACLFVEMDFSKPINFVMISIMSLEMAVAQLAQSKLGSTVQHQDNFVYLFAVMGK